MGKGRKKDMALNDRRAHGEGVHTHTHTHTHTLHEGKGRQGDPMNVKDPPHTHTHTHTTQ